MLVSAFTTHKRNEFYSDCQDCVRINMETKILAISDGVTQSFFPNIWAGILASFFVEYGHCTEEDRLSLCAKWEESVRNIIQEHKNHGKNTKLAERMLNAHKGAGATLCGIKFNNSHQWEGQVLGDSCIISVKKSNSQYRIEIFSSVNENQNFDNYPDYYCSIQETTGRGTIKDYTGTIDNDNLLLLVSDPFVKFLYNNKDNISCYINEILQLNTHNDFCELVENWRNKGMDDDDSTLCIIEWDGSEKFNLKHLDSLEELIKSEEKECEEQMYNPIPQSILKSALEDIYSPQESFISKKRPCQKFISKVRHKLTKLNIRQLKIKLTCKKQKRR